MKKLNPKWLKAAIVYREDGTRYGTVGSVNGDRLIVLVKGIPHKWSAKELDKKALIRKPGAIHRKYI